MNNALYLDDSYLKEFDATIIKINSERYIILDKTAFYPQSGGQPNDTGKIFCNNIECLAKGIFKDAQ